MPRNNAQSWIAGGTIQPSVFVKVSTSADNTVLQATAGSSSHGDQVIGISQAGSYDPPGFIGSATDAARAGLPIEVFALGDVCLLLSSAGWTAGDYLKSDANGNGITSSTTGDNIGAQALSTVLTGAYGRVQILISAHA